ncbi:sugar kinase, partial [Erwinia amylovora]|uniref:PfkB family carbohydrate kinase n=1 Tax=Erwinia amylovora TaxID=552 RepID=UPI001005D332
ATGSGFIKRGGGAEVNWASGLARLGLKVGWLSRMGNDAFGRCTCQQLDKEEVDRRHVTPDRRYPTGFQIKSKVDVGSDPLVEYFRIGSAASHLPPAAFDRDNFCSALLPHLSGVEPSLLHHSLALPPTAARA